MMQPNLKFLNQLPRPSSFGSQYLVIFDEKLPKYDAGFAKWIREVEFKYPVRSGEKLKSIDEFPKHIKKIAALVGDCSPRKLQIISIGGGSVGDFAGFVASVFKRGVPVVHIPSTWLAAIDSAHGGKTGLNVGTVKNQIGSFHQAKEILLVKSLLQSQNQERAFEASSELLKIALLTGGSLWQKLSRAKKFDDNLLWSTLKLAIQAKYNIVKKDPYETSGHRHLLNFGHSMGHVFESLFQFPHGVAVMCGLEFAILWSLDRKVMSENNYSKMNSQPIWKALIKARQNTGWKNLSYPALLLESENQYISRLQQDKKKQSKQSLRFVFLEQPGKAKIQEVQIAEVIQQLRHQRRVLS